MIKRWFQFITHKERTHKILDVCHAAHLKPDGLYNYFHEIVTQWFLRFAKHEKMIKLVIALSKNGSAQIAAVAVFVILIQVTAL